MAHRSRSSRSTTNTASGSASASSGEAAGSSRDGATDQVAIAPQAPGGFSGESSSTAIRSAVLEILADPEVIRQFGTVVAAASSIPSTSGGTTEAAAGPGTVTGGATAPGEAASTAPGPSGSGGTAGTGNITPSGRYSYTNDLLSLQAAVPSLVRLPAECSCIVTPL